MIPLDATPDHHRLITNDSDAKCLLMEQGLLDKLLEFGQRAPRGLSEPWSARIYHTGHPTHWIIADFYCGFTNPADNGYAVEAIPKSRCSLEQFRHRERHRAPPQFPYDIASDESGTLDTTNN